MKSEFHFGFRHILLIFKTKWDLRKSEFSPGISIMNYDFLLRIKMLYNLLKQFIKIYQKFIKFINFVLAVSWTMCILYYLLMHDFHIHPSISIHDFIIIILLLFCHDFPLKSTYMETEKRLILKKFLIT